jgi:hypothetical protein
MVMVRSDDVLMRAVILEVENPLAGIDSGDAVSKRMSSGATTLFGS